MLALKNATYIDPITLEFIKTNLIVEEGENKNIIFSDIIPDGTDIIDCSGMYVTKSFVIGHHHAYSALATGMPAPKNKPKNFYEILKYVWWNLDKKLDNDQIYISALVTAMNAAKNGSTFIIDHHSSPFSVEGSLETIAKAFEQVGVSHLLCYEISDRDGLDIAQKGLDETEKYLQNNQALVGLHASFTVGDKTLKKAAQLMEKYDSGIHIHAAEDEIDQIMSIMDYGQRVIERLNHFGFLKSSKTILAHALHINNYEREILQKSSAFVVQNAESNLNNKVGFFKRKYLNKSKILMGTDGMHSDMIKAAQSAYFYGQLIDSPSPSDIYYQLRNNHFYIEQNKFKGDGQNNLIVFNYNTHTQFNKDNFLGHFFYSFNNSIIEHVISNGRLIVKNKKLTQIDEDSIIIESRQQAIKLWKKL